MEILMVCEDGASFQVVGRELSEEERALLDEGSYIAYRYRGNRFESAEETSEDGLTPVWGAVKETT